MEEMHRVRTMWGGAQSFHALSSWNLGMPPPSPHTHESTNLEADASLVVQSFYGGFITQAWLIKCLAIELNPISRPILLPRGQDSWKFPPFNHMLDLFGVGSLSLETKGPHELFQNHKLRMVQRNLLWIRNDNPVIQKTPRVFEALYRNREQRPNIFTGGKYRTCLTLHHKQKPLFYFYLNSKACK